MVKIRGLLHGTKDPWDDIETSAKLYRLKAEQRKLGRDEGEDVLTDLMDRIRQNPPQDFTQIARLIQLVTEKPLVVTPLTCERCGANLPLPSSGQYVQCSHCGYNYHATNVIEMLERILR